jgi:hypothetical protein
MYLYRSVDKAGLAVDFFLSRKPGPERRPILTVLTVTQRNMSTFLSTADIYG